MSMLFDDIDEILNHLNTFKNRYYDLGKAMKYVDQGIQFLDLQKSSLISLPENIAEQESTVLSDHIGRYKAFWINSLPLLPQIDPIVFEKSSSAMSMAVATATDIVYIANVADPAYSKWRTDYNNRLTIFQQEIELPNKVHDLLIQLDSRLGQDFVIMEKNYFTTQGVQKDINAGIALRNLLEHYKGRLIDKARQQKKENITWKIMIDRLYTESKQTPEYYTLLDQESVYKSLFGNQLSNIAKDTQKGQHTQRDIKELYTEVLNHIYTVLSLISF